MTDKNQEELEKKQATAPEDQEQSGKSIIYNALVNDEDDGEKKNIEHLKDVLQALSINGLWFKRQLGVLALILLGIIIYISNRYQAQSEMIEEDKLHEDLENTWAVVAEAIQTILRREAYPHPYEALKALTRTNKHMDQETIHEFIQTLEVSDAVKAELMTITPDNYTGV